MARFKNDQQRKAVMLKLSVQRIARQFSRGSTAYFSTRKGVATLEAELRKRGAASVVIPTRGAGPTIESEAGITAKRAQYLLIRPPASESRAQTKRRYSGL